MTLSSNMILSSKQAMRYSISTVALLTAGLPALLSGNAAASGGAIDPFVFRLAIFVMAVFVGYYVVWSVTPALHTPLMSETNAISSVIVVGALLLLFCLLQRLFEARSRRAA